MEFNKFGVVVNIPACYVALAILLVGFQHEHFTIWRKNLQVVSNLGILVGSAISATGLVKRRIMGEQDRKGRFGILEMTLTATMMAIIP